MNKFSKMKVHWWNYNYCLFAAYLASVAIGYGWISDTKFQKFSNKDWIWICKRVFRIWIRNEKINIRSPLLLMLGCTIATGVLTVVANVAIATGPVVLSLFFLYV